MLLSPIYAFFLALLNAVVNVLPVSDIHSGNTFTAAISPIMGYVYYINTFIPISEFVTLLRDSLWFYGIMLTLKATMWAINFARGRSGTN